jgi:ferrous iron transport protein B
VVIVNAAALERNLYLVAELLALPGPVVVGLNMIDVAESLGVHVEAHVLEAALGVPVIPMVASKNQGLGELVEATVHQADHPEAYAPNRPTIREAHRPVLEELHGLIAGKLPPPYPEDWVALKLLEGDSEITQMVRQAAPEVWGRVHDILMRHEDAYIDIAGGRYEWIGRMVRAAIVRPRAGAISLTDRVDRVAAHPLWGLLVLVGILALVFRLTYSLAMPVVHWLEVAILDEIVLGLKAMLAAAPAWFSGLVVDGLVQGAGTVLTFLPIMVAFFAALGLLEDVGYLARAAYVMDRLMHPMGLHGKSFMPLFLGFGCNVPAVLGTRIVEGKRARLLTILLAPLVPCTARMAVITFLAPAFFGEAAALVSWSLVGTNLAVLVLVGVVLHRLAFKSERSAFIMEMPLYHSPSLRTIGLYVWNNTLAFVRKAGTIIVVASLAVWALSAFPGGDLQHSLLAGLGRWLEPAGRLMGLGDWRLIVSLLTSFVAKENSIATLGVLYRGGGQGLDLAQRVAQTLTPAAALAFLVVQMLFVPCAATVAVMRQETGTWKWTAFGVGLLLVISLGVGIAVYQVSRLLV